MIIVKFLFGLIASVAAALHIRWLVKKTRLPVLGGGWPVIGHVLALVDTKRLSDQLDEFCLKMEREQGVKGPFQMNILGTPYVIIQRTEEIREALTTRRPFDFGAGPNFTQVADSVGCSENLLSVMGEDHVRLRKLHAPAFTKTAICRLEPVVREKVDRLAAVLGEEVERGNGSLAADALLGLCTAFTLDVIMKVAFDLDVDDLGSLHKDPSESPTAPFKKLFDVLGRRMFHPLPLFKYGIFIGQEKRDQRDIVDPVVKRARDAVEANRARTPGEANNVISTLLAVDDPEFGKLSQTQLQSAALVVLLGGYETTRSTLLFCLAHLAANPGIQRKIFDEASSHVDERGLVTDESRALTLFPYCNAVIQETLRLCSPAAFNMFVVDRPWTVDGCELPSGTNCFSLIKYSQCREENFTDAKSFRPERWLKPRNEQEFPIHEANAFLAFGGGRRICIGMNLGKMELILAVVLICSQYEISFLPGHSFPSTEFNMTFQTSPFGLQFKLRN